MPFLVKLGKSHLGFLGLAHGEDGKTGENFGKI